MNKAYPYLFLSEIIPLLDPPPIIGIEVRVWTSDLERVEERYRGP